VPGGGTYNVGYTTAAGTDRAFVLTRVDAGGELVDSSVTTARRPSTSPPRRSPHRPPAPRRRVRARSRAASPPARSGARRPQDQRLLKLTGKKKNKVSCTTKQAESKVTLRLAKAGKTIARGSGKATVNLRGTVSKGRYTLHHVR